MRFFFNVIFLIAFTDFKIFFHNQIINNNEGFTDRFYKYFIKKTTKNFLICSIFCYFSYKLDQ